MMSDWLSGKKMGNLIAGAGDMYLGLQIPEGFEIRTTGDDMAYVYMGPRLIGQYYTDVEKAVIANAILREIETWQKRGVEGQ